MLSLKLKLEGRELNELNGLGEWNGTTIVHPNGSPRLVQAAGWPRWKSTKGRWIPISKLGKPWPWISFPAPPRFKWPSFATFNWSGKRKPVSVGSHSANQFTSVGPYCSDGPQDWVKKFDYPNIVRPSVGLAKFSSISNIHMWLLFPRLGWWSSVTQFVSVWFMRDIKCNKSPATFPEFRDIDHQLTPDPPSFS